MRELVIAGRRIADDTPMYVVAEIGHNHNGSVELAKQLIVAAKIAGADAVKFQYRCVDDIYTEELKQRPMVGENAFAPTYGEHRKILEFSRQSLWETCLEAKTCGLACIVTVFGFAAAERVARYNIVDAFKIASGDLTHTPLLECVAKRSMEHVAGLCKPLIVSTGGATLADVVRAYDTIMPINQQLAFLQCTTCYPTKYHEMNLRVIETYREAFPECVIGLSSHTDTGAMALPAYILGARIIEKHFTLNHDMKGTDHGFALDPQQFAKMTRDLRRLSVALGDSVKRPYPSEREPTKLRAKSLVAARDIAAGTKLTREDIAIKAPGGRIPPYELGAVIGT
ncbi:MAG TPA: N-acetylneuraminate synthase family protein, partial [Phycisphaerae bacterium]|nr:N-acetylneuraminate synthase family protein [Phycisphaerae bacterium]